MPIRLYGEPNSPKMMAIKMYLNSKQVEFEELPIELIPNTLADSELPLLMENYDVLMEGYDPQTLSSLF